MTIRDWWWEYTARLQEAEDIQNISKTPAKFRGPEWDEARKKHAEKMRGKHGPSSNPSN